MPRCHSAQDADATQPPTGAAARTEGSAAPEPPGHPGSPGLPTGRELALAEGQAGRGGGGAQQGHIVATGLVDERHSQRGGGLCRPHQAALERHQPSGKKSQKKIKTTARTVANGSWTERGECQRKREASRGAHRTAAGGDAGVIAGGGAKHVLAYTAATGRRVAASFAPPAACILFLSAVGPALAPSKRVVLRPRSSARGGARGGGQCTEHQRCVQAERGPGLLRADAEDGALPMRWGVSNGYR